MTNEEKELLITANNEQIKAKLDDVFDAGKKAEYDAFWDEYQNNGNRTDYRYAFAGPGWNGDTLKPKYSISPIYTDDMFSRNSNDIDLKDVLDKCGVVLDTSRATSMRNTFNITSLLKIPTISVVSATNTDNLFYYSGWLVTVEKVIVTENTTYKGWFTSCGSLENITFEGVVAHDLDFKDCKKLTLNSLTDILIHLKDFTGTGEENTRTLTLSQDSVDILNEDSPSWIVTMLGDQKKWNLTVV